MKSICYIVAITLGIVVMVSCAKKDNKTCTGGNQTTITFNISSADSFKYYHAQNYDLAHCIRQTLYDSLGTYSKFNMMMIINNVCPFEDPLISPSVNNAIQNANDLKDTVGASEFTLGTSPNVINAVPHVNGGHYTATLSYHSTTGNDPAVLIATNIITIPAQGSWRQDSIYFFSNFQNMAITVDYNYR